MSSNSNVNQKNLKENFDWEIPYESVPIPSEGLIYSPDSFLYKKNTIQIKSMTAKEEDILMSQAYIKDGLVIDKLLASCITDKNVNPDEILIGDRNAILIAIRITGYGHDYHVTHICNNCDHKNNINVILSDLPIKRLEINPVVEGKNLFEFILPVSKKKINFKYQTGLDQKNQEAIEKNLSKVGINKQSDNTVITTLLENLIVSIDGITDKNKIKSFINKMPALDSKKLREYYSKNEPGISNVWKYNCILCKFENEFNFPLTSEFFWPKP